MQAKIVNSIEVYNKVLDSLLSGERITEEGLLIN